VSGTCLHLDLTTVCDDTDWCTVGDVCVGGRCMGAARNCSDGNPCTTDSCVPDSGVCLSTNAPGPCDDGDVCTVGDACTNGGCVGMAVACDDDNLCTMDSCDRRSGCIYTDISSECNDTSVCTDDSCSPILGCVYSNRSLECDDGNFCTADVCDAAMGCVYTTPVSQCDDGVACTRDTCHVATGCVHTPDDVLCSDHKPCTVNKCTLVGCTVNPVIANGASCPLGPSAVSTGVCVNGECVVRVSGGEEPAVTSGVESEASSESGSRVVGTLATVSAGALTVLLLVALFLIVKWGKGALAL
jgi:slime mold repeat-containing protein